MFASQHGHGPGHSHAQKKTPEAEQTAGVIFKSPTAPIVPDMGTLQGRAAKKGHALIEVADGYVIAKGAHSRHCTDLQTVDALLTRIGA